MPTTQSTLLFMSAALALNLTPGPDMLYVATRGASEGRAAGLVSTLGIAAGCLIHLAALALGLAALLARVPTAYNIVRLAGAAYLLYLGVRAFLRPGPPVAAATVAPVALPVVFGQGVLTNVLNPKVALFMLAFLPQFVDPARGNPVRQIVILGLLFNASGTIVNAGIAVLASRATDWLRTRTTATRALQRAAGTVFIALGTRLACSNRA